MRRIVFPRLWPARSYAYRQLPVTLQPGGDASIDTPPAYAGGMSTSELASGRIIDGEARSPGRSFLGDTARALQAGPAPDRIDRGTTARYAGKIGAAANRGGIAGWPYDGSALMIPHQRIPRRPITVSPFSRTIDTGVVIPVAAIGDPVRR